MIINDNNQKNIYNSNLESNNEIEKEFIEILINDNNQKNIYNSNLESTNEVEILIDEDNINFLEKCKKTYERIYNKYYFFFKVSEFIYLLIGYILFVILMISFIILSIYHIVSDKLNDTSINYVINISIVWLIYLIVGLFINIILDIFRRTSIYKKNLDRIINIIVLCELLILTIVIIIFKKYNF